MASLESTFSRNEIETLIESISYWEETGNQEYHMMQMIKSAPMPPEDHEAFEIMERIKDHYRSREKEINESRVTRQEKAVFLKAKLMMVRREMSIDQLFDMAANADPTEAPQSEKAPAPSADATKIPVRSEESTMQLAEEYMKDIGIWDRFQNFVRERRAESQKDSE